MIHYEWDSHYWIARTPEGWRDMQGELIRLGYILAVEEGDWPEDAGIETPAPKPGSTGYGRDLK